MATITPYLLYEDCEAMLDWLARAFGFEETLRYADSDGVVGHAEMKLGGALVYMGWPSPEYRNPRSLGAQTVSVYVELDADADVDGLCERARAAGAEITEEPAEQEYGHRRFGARDPEGHDWFFARPTREVAPEEWGATAAGS